MNTLGNIIWMLLGGLLLAMLYWVYGLFFLCTIIGIPFGVQLLKIGGFVLCPFGRDLVGGPSSQGCLNTGLNVLWILKGWFELAIMHAIFGLAFCVTIIGIPLGVQHFKIAGKTLLPFGKEIVRI